MDPKTPAGEMWLAPPPAGSAGALRLPAARERPGVDEHVVAPETREQLVRGRKVLAMPALPPHADQHFKLDYILGAHVKEGYVGSTELLTRSDVSSDFATDTCIRRRGIDPRTDSRYLEELAFEVVNEQSLRDVTEQAEELTARGVRRVVAIFVKRGEVCEWSSRSSKWVKLEVEGELADPTLSRPIRVRELLDAAEADNAVARALAEKKNPVIVQLVSQGRSAGLKEGRDAGLKEGQEDGLRRGIEPLCEVLGIELTAARRAWLEEADAAALTDLMQRLRADRRWPG